MYNIFNSKISLKEIPGQRARYQNDTEEYFSKTGLLSFRCTLLHTGAKIYL
jgi:hypothetical protein